MVDPREPDRADGNRSSSHFQKTVMLRDWWLVKSHQEFEGKRFGVAGTELMASIEQRAVRVFTSAPIVKAFDVFTLETSDGICILLKGFINKERTIKNGFGPEIFRHFVFGFPPCWDEISKKCFEKGSSRGTGVDSMSLRSDKDVADHTVLTPCKNKERKLEDEHIMEAKRVCNPVRSQNDSYVIKDNLVSPEVDTGMSGEHSASQVGEFAKRRAGPVSKDTQSKTKHNETRASPSLVSNYCEKNTETRLKVNSSKGAGFAKVKGLYHSGTTAEEDESCVQEEYPTGEKTKRRINFDPEVTPHKQARKEDTGAVFPEPSNYKRTRSGRLLVSTSEFWRNQVPVNDAGPVSKDRIQRKNATQESVRLEQSKIKPDEIRVSPRRKNATQESVRLEQSKIKHDEIRASSRRKNAAQESVRLEQSKLKHDKIRASPSLVSKYCEKNTEIRLKVNSSKGANFAKDKGLYHSATTPEEDESCVQEESPTGEKTKRSINFDLEVTPRKKARKEDTGVVFPEPSNYKRSRSGRLLVSTLEFWRNQVPVYDADRNIVGIKEGGINTKTPASKGSGSETRRRR